MWGILADVLGRLLPQQRHTLQLSFSLAEAKLLENLFAGAGFRDIQVERETRSGAYESFDDYWNPIEAGTGSQPQAYLSLPEQDRRAVRAEVTARVSKFESNGRLLIDTEMLVGRGRA